MRRTGTGLREVFATSRGAGLLAINALAAFGLLSGALQFVGQFLPDVLPSTGVVLSVATVTCLAWGLFRAFPRNHLRHAFRHPAVAVTIEPGDLFGYDGHLVVGFTDTFDTTTSGTVISAKSVQGQLVRRRYAGESERLDRDLAAGLADVPPVAVETRRTKRLGKLQRYPIGTVVPLGQEDRLVFAVAYSRMGNDLVAGSTVDDLWSSLGSLWAAIGRHGQRETVTMPLVGAGLARIDALDNEALLKMILLSFVAHSRRAVVCPELRIVLRPAELNRIDILEVAAFLRSL